MARTSTVPLAHPESFFIGGSWVAPSSDSSIDVIDAGTEELAFTIAEAQAADMARAVEAARTAFDTGPWPQLTHAERAGYLRALSAALMERNDVEPKRAGLLRSRCLLGDTRNVLTYLGVLAALGVAGLVWALSVGSVWVPWVAW
jgi:hypothetical protein